jgi:predicted dehydrogenase
VGTIENHYEFLIHEFIEAVHGHGHPFATGEDGLKSVTIATAILESSRTKSAVTLSA